MTEERSRAQIVAWIAAGAVLLVLAWKLLSPAGGGGGAPVSVSRPPAASAASPAHGVYVHVAGAVRRPGLYRVRSGARIAAAIRRAGGPRRGADLSAVNLAMRVQDGQQILMPRVGAPSSASAGTTGASGASGKGGSGMRLSLASATVEQLEQLDGIGPTLAQRIVQYRERHGGFRSLAELKRVEGIGDKRFEALKDSLGP